MLKFDIITIFPDFFRESFDYGIIRRARLAGVVGVEAHDLRHWTSDKHKQVDDRPFGGGEGMVLMPEPIFAAVENLTGSSKREEFEKTTRVVLLSPQGKSLTQAFARELATEAEHVVLICGRYEGVDERVAEALVTDEISIGDYVLSGGEPAAIVLIDAVTRLVPGALGNEDSTLHESFSDGLLDHPHFTRPTNFRELAVPEVLLSGHHGEIANWRNARALEKTKRNRPDMLTNRDQETRENNVLNRNK